MPIHHVSDHDARRAIAAFRRRCNHEGAIYQQPTTPEGFEDSATRECFIVLRNIRGVLAVYRERCDRRSPKFVARHEWPLELASAIDA